MNRRAQLKTLILLTGGALIIPSWMYTAYPGKKKYAKQRIIKELDYLTLDEEGVSRFVEDYFKSVPDTFENNLRWSSYFFLRTSSKNSQNIFQLVRFYLLSSDFFQYKMDTKRKIRYIGLFNPYKSPVANPYSYIHH